MEHTLVLVKPDGVKKKICGEILARYERQRFDNQRFKIIASTA